jgi:hypothetical protein
MGLLEASEVKQSWLSENIELTASDVFGGTRAVFIRDGKSTYWIEYRRPREGAPYNAGLVIYRTDPPSPIFIDSPNPEDRANSEPGLAVGTDIWMLNLDSYIYSATGRATGSMSLTTNKTTTLYSGNISLEVIPSSTTQKITLKVNRKADISPPPLPKLTEASTWVFENSELLQPGFEDVDSEIEFFEMSIDGKISRLKDSRAYNYAPTYLDPFQNRKTLYTRELPEGIYSLSIRTVDVWGNRSQWTTPQKVSIDRGIPIVTEEIKVSGVSRENLSIEFNGTKDIGSKICISQIINEDGFVLKTSQREVSPEFQFKKDSEIVGQMQVFDCLGNGSSNDFYLKNNYYAASKSARTGKWVSSNVADGAVTCIGKCSASISAAGRIRILMGSGKASAMLGNKSIATFDDSIANQIRTSVPVDIGKQKRVIRVSGSNFTFVGIASINLSVSGQLKKLRQSPPADRSLEDPIQGRLSKFGFSPEDFDQEWNVTPLYRGTTLEDPTLDLCSAIYKSEENREHRRQLTVLRSNSPYIFLSSEVVKYKDKSAADAALAELKANYEACVKNKGGVERDGTFVDYSFSSLPASNAVLAPEGSRVVVRAQIGKGVTARQLLAFYQFKGEMFTGLYIVKGGEVALSEAEVKRWFDAASIMAQRLDVKF